ncbi:MAG: sigma 54-interacting transcriptional regulator [Phycisphaerae bacterium]|nr:sigma 54-interacting transcriptional regulator [Phycisphaerae bacterium]
MRKFMPLLLDIWREACRHIEISESVDRITPILAQRVPVNRVVVRRLDLQRCCVETVAVGQAVSDAAAESTRSEGTSERFEGVVNWCRRGEVLRGPVDEVEGLLPGLLPAGLEGEVLAGGLRIDAEPVGVLILVGGTVGIFRGEHESIMRALLEPFAMSLENDHQLRELTRLREAAEADRRSLLSRLGRQDISDSVVGAETGLRGVLERVELVAHSDVPVLILGETGSGKEVVARAIHNRSRRTGGPFLRVNCGALPPELIDSELFGHERGSFTGAVAMRKGWFERADGGTLFLDEMGELPAAAQVRLLRILQDGSYERVGGQRQLHVDVRVVAATNRDLHQMVADGLFREDLWYRIAVFPIRIPPLRERIEDIPALAAHFALRAAQRLGTPSLVPAPEDNNLLVAYPWPGNVRELAAVIERAAILGNGHRLEVAKALGVGMSLPSPRAAVAGESATRWSHRGELATLDAAMKTHIEQALLRTRGRIEGPHGAARLLDINPHTLRARMRKLQVDWSHFRPLEAS